MISINEIKKGKDLAKEEVKTRENDKGVEKISLLHAVSQNSIVREGEFFLRFFPHIEHPNDITCYEKKQQLGWQVALERESLYSRLKKFTPFSELDYIFMGTQRAVIKSCGEQPKDVLNNLDYLAFGDFACDKEDGSDLFRYHDLIPKVRLPAVSHSEHIFLLSQELANASKGLARDPNKAHTYIQYIDDAMEHISSNCHLGNRIVEALETLAEARSNILQQIQ